VSEAGRDAGGYGRRCDVGGSVVCMEPDTYCREIEAYLCRKNDGHLVRVVGPAFGLVSGWAVQGVPFKVACRGIDRYVERYYAKGPRRRPVRVEFCEADVLDAFDEWKRAVGVGMAGSVEGHPRGEGEAAGGADAPGRETEDEGARQPSRPGHSLRAHLDRAVTRLTDLQANGGLPETLDAVVERLIEQLAHDREISRTLRGEAREAYLRVLEHRDADLLEAARQVTPAETLSAQDDEAAEELAGYRARMPQEAYSRAVRAAAEKLLRDHWKLPVIAYAGSRL
jgi:hypothetical protein